MDGLEPPTLFLQGICTTIVLHRLIRDIPKKGDLNETKKERMPRTTVYGSHFAEHRKLCNDSRRT